MQMDVTWHLNKKNQKDISIRTKSAKKQPALIHKNAQSTLEKEKVEISVC